MSDFTISAVIPSYNSGKYVERAIRSVLAQTVRPHEIIVVDDGSTDDTAQVVKEFADNVIYIRQQNAGASAARNTGIKAATGSWIAFLDADDEWLADKLKLQVENLQSNPDLVWTTANFIRCACQTETRSPHIPPRAGRKLLDGRGFFESYFKALLNNTDGWTGTMLIRKDVLERAGLFTPGLKRGNDYDMWWRIAYMYPEIGYIPDPLAVYHIDIAGSIIHKHKDPDILQQQIEKHLELSAGFGRYEDFKPVARKLLKKWIRGMLFDADSKGVKQLTGAFGDILPAGFRTVARTMAICPKTSAAVCRFTGKCLRSLGAKKPLSRT